MDAKFIYVNIFVRSNNIQKQISLQNNHHHHHGDPELRHQMVMRGCWVSCFGFEQRAWGGDIIVHTAVQHPFPFNGFEQQGL